jgi:hypothetical protein
MCANVTFFPMRVIMLLFLFSSVCRGQEKGGGAAITAQSPDALPKMTEMEKVLKSSEQLLAAVDAQVKVLEDKYVQQRKLSADASLGSVARDSAVKEAAKVTDLLKAMTKERDALATQIKSVRSLLGLVPDVKKSDAPAATTAPPGKAPAEGSKKSN